MSHDSVWEAAIRLRIIDWVRERAEANGGFLHRDELLNFEIDGNRLPVIDYSRGIRNPQAFQSTLSIVSSVNGPYDDIESADGLLHYAYRSNGSADNAKLRNALITGQPMILFRKEVPNVYTPVVPVFVVADDSEAESFTIALDEAFSIMVDIANLSDAQRSYAVRLARQRLHQPAFRTRVIVAYQSRCAICELRHGSLLDAAHILPDSHERGVPTVDNGLALCKIHHAAYDRDILSISPEYRVHVDGAVLREVDGPMLRHGIQEMHGRDLVVPTRRSDRPNREFLAERFDAFKARTTAGAPS